MTKSWLSMTRGLQITVDVPGEEKERRKTLQFHFVLDPCLHLVAPPPISPPPFRLTQLIHNHMTSYLKLLLLTVNVVKVSKDHLHMIPL